MTESQEYIKGKRDSLPLGTAERAELTQKINEIQQDVNNKQIANLTSLIKENARTQDWVNKTLITIGLLTLVVTALSYFKK